MAQANDTFHIIAIHYQ